MSDPSTAEPIPAASAVNAQRRLKGIDICRSLAILVAMLSHVIVEFQIFWPGPSLSWVRFFMQMAPPIFICLFGAMLEIAYVPQFHNGKAEVAIRRMLSRAAQCYILYAVSVLALYLAGNYPLGFTVRTILMDGATPYTDILKFYACVLLIAPLLIVIRNRLGLWPLLAFAILVHAAYPLIKTIPEPPIIGNGYLSALAGFLYGAQRANVGGPSLLHGLTFVCMGVVMGSAVKGIFSGNSDRLRQGVLWLVALFLIGLGPSIYFWSSNNEVLAGITSLRIRNNNHPFYFALGLSFTSATLALCIFLFDYLHVRTLDAVRFMGTTSLFTFCFGNVILYVQPFSPRTLTESTIHGVVFGVWIVLQSWIFFKLASGTVPEGPRYWRAASLAVRGLIEAIKDVLDRMLTGVSGSYARLVSDASNQRATSERPAVGTDHPRTG